MSVRPISISKRPATAGAHRMRLADEGAVPDPSSSGNDPVAAGLRTSIALFCVQRPGVLRMRTGVRRCPEVRQSDGIIPPELRADAGRMNDNRSSRTAGARGLSPAIDPSRKGRPINRLG